MIDEIYEERVKLQRVMVTESCWRCCKEKACSDLGLCTKCLVALKEEP